MGSRNTSAGITQNINLGIDKKRSTDTTDIRIRGRGINETLNIGLNSEYVRKDGAIDQITTRSHTQLTDIGTNTHAQIDTAIGTITPLTATTVGSLIAGVDAKATPVDADIVGFSDTQATNLLKKLTWANVKAFLKTYFDTLYNLYTLPTASDSVLGGVKVGSRLSIAAGVLSADVQGGAPTDAHYLTDQAEAGLSAEVVVTANGKSLVTAADYAAMRTLLNVADGANNYTHPSGDGNLHVPANSTTNNGKVLTASAVAGTYTWETPSATVADESITNAKLAHIATSIIKGRVTAETGDVEDLTAANVRTIINVEDGATKYPDTGEQAFLDADHTKLDGIAAGANAYVHPNHSGDVTSVADGAQTIAAKAVHVAMLADGTDGELITWGADGVATTVAVGTATHVLTSNGAGAAPTFQAAPSGGSSSFPVGAGMDFFGVTEPTGWLFADSKTIGDASSGGTARANADAETLFALLWAATANTELIIQDSSGNPTTRGASAAADFAAHKRMPLPDKRGRVSVVKDNMGGTSANRVTSAQADLVCGNAGAETHQLSAAELPAHDHGTTGAHTHGLITNGEDGSLTGFPTDPGRKGVGLSTESAGSHAHSSVGSGTAHNNMSPYLVCNYIIKY